MTTTTNAPTLPTDRHDVDIAARVAYAAYLAAGRKHNATVLSAPARIRQVYRRMQADQFAGDYARADIDAVVKWVSALTDTSEAFRAAEAALDDLHGRQDELANDASRRRRVDEARDDAAGRLRVARNAELRELAAGYNAVRRLGRLEGTVADIEVLTRPYHGIQSIERDDAGRITTVVRARCWPSSAS